MPRSLSYHAVTETEQYVHELTQEVFQVFIQPNKFKQDLSTDHIMSFRLSHGNFIGFSLSHWNPRYMGCPLNRS